MTRREFEGLSYPDRWTAATRAGHELTVYVLATPVAGGRPQLGGIAPQSGIVGQRTVEPDVLLVHYEGWVHGAMQYAELDERGRWEAAVYHAAGRAFVEYPTIAQQVMRTESLHEVGFIRAGDLAPTVTDETAVSRWLFGDQTLSPSTNNESEERS